MHSEHGEALDNSVGDDDCDHLPSGPPLNQPKLMDKCSTLQSPLLRGLDSPGLPSLDNPRLDIHREDARRLSAFETAQPIVTYSPGPGIQARAAPASAQSGSQPFGPLYQKQDLGLLFSPQCKPASSDEPEVAWPFQQRIELAAGMVNLSTDLHKELQHNLSWRASEHVLSLPFSGRGLVFGAQLNAGHESTLEPQLSDQSIFEEFVRYKIRSEADVKYRSKV